MESYEVLIVGAGVAGMSAAIAAFESGAKSVLLTDSAERLGGVLPQCIHKGFGLSTCGTELTGPEYSEKIERELSKTGVSICLSTAVVSVDTDRTAILSGKDGLRRVAFERLVLASGSRERTIGELTVSGTRPAGIFTAGEAQELINLRHKKLGEKLVIVGSGDLGMIMARRFVLEGKTVAAMIEKEDHYGGMARNYHRCIEEYKIPLSYSTVLTRVHGQERVSAVTVRGLTDGTERTIPCDTLVTALGLLPERSLLRTVGEPPWVTLCGNCRKIHDIADSAAEDGRKIFEAG